MRVCMMLYYVLYNQWRAEGHGIGCPGRTRFFDATSHKFFSYPNSPPKFLMTFFSPEISSNHLPKILMTVFWHFSQF